MKSIIVQMARLVICSFMLSVAGVSNADYNSLLHGADVTAQGHNPEWSMKILDNTNTVSFTATDIGTLNYRYPYIAPTLISELNTTVFAVPNDSHVMSVEVNDVACTDSVTGKSHEVRVVVWVDNHGYVGCGDVTGH